MGPIHRRHFLSLAAAPVLAGGAAVEESGGLVRARGANYSWQWNPASDEFRLLDLQGRTITFGPLQPAVLVRTPSAPQNRCSAGVIASRKISGNRLEVTYGDVNGAGKLLLA